MNPMHALFQITIGNETDETHVLVDLPFPEGRRKTNNIKSKSANNNFR